jgi:hypothetical protein
MSLEQVEPENIRSEEVQAIIDRIAGEIRENSEQMNVQGWVLQELAKNPSTGIGEKSHES